MKDSFKKMIINSVVFCLFFAGCMMESNTCASCHMDKKKLKEVAAPIKERQSSGDG